LKVKLPVNDIQEAMEKVLTEELNLTVTTQEPTTNMYYFQGGIGAMTAETARDATPSDDQVIGL
jgi:hypothetical protein